MPANVERVARTIPLAVTFVVTCVALFGPPADVSPDIPYLDKAVHFALFAALALTSRLARIPVRWTLCWLAVFAVASEVIQGLLPYERRPDPADVAADLLGAAVGSLLAHALGRTQPDSRSPIPAVRDQR